MVRVRTEVMTCAVCVAAVNRVDAVVAERGEISVCAGVTDDEEIAAGRQRQRVDAGHSAIGQRAREDADVRNRIALVRRIDPWDSGRRPDDVSPDECDGLAAGGDVASVGSRSEPAAVSERGRWRGRDHHRGT
jgi:hypothetical protein